MGLKETVQIKILDRMYRRGSTKVYTAKDFLDLGSRAAVDQALSRLIGTGAIKRKGRGLYYLSRTRKNLGIQSTPDIDEFARAIARRTGSHVVASGAAAANQLGLSTQVPAKIVYLTDGKSRTLQVGNTEVRFKHVSPKDFPFGSPMSALVFQALRHLGKNAITSDTIARLRRRLSAKDREQLKRDARYATGWIAEAVSRLSEGDFRHG